MTDYASEPNLDPMELGDLFARSGIHRPTTDYARLARMINGANVLLTARSGEKLVGVLRALSDNAWILFVSDLAVDREFQRKGIGRELLRRASEVAGDECAVGLFAAPGAEEYYSRVGLEKVPSAWRAQRKRGP